VGRRGPLRVFLRGIDALAGALLAPRCAACARLLESPLAGCVCPVCWRTTEQLATPVWTDRHIVSGAAAGRYEGPLRDIIHAYKYEGRRSLAGPLARLMAAAGDAVLRDADVLVPVPLHPLRRLRRGFNQASDLAYALDLPVAHALWRRHATAPQVALPAIARRTNVRNAFILAPRWSSRRLRQCFGGHVLEDRVVVLIDDVRTTGATLDACARTLRSAGVREVRALTTAAADLRP